VFLLTLAGRKLFLFSVPYITLNKPMVTATLSLKYRKLGDIEFLLQILALAILYFIAGKVGLSLAYIHPSVSAVWPATGIAMAALILWGYEFWPAVFFGAFFVYFSTAETFLTSLGIALGNTFEAVLAAYFIKRLISDKKIFTTPANVVKYIISIGIVATLPSAIIGISNLYLAGSISSGEILSVGLTWWLGDTGGALLIAPFLIQWINDHYIKWSLNKFLEFVPIILFISLINFYTFSDGIPSLYDIFPFIFITIPFIIWLATRFSQRELSTAILFLYLITLWQTLNYTAPSLKELSNETLIIIQVFMGTIFIAFMPLSADVQMKKVLNEILELRIKQQKSISELGEIVLSGNSLATILKDAAQIIYDVLKVDYCKILKLLPGEKKLLLLEGIGWEDGLVGKAIVGTDLDSQAGYTLMSKEPVIVIDFSDEKRFNFSPLLSDRHVVSGISCIIRGKDKPFGVLGAHSKTKAIFTSDDVYFFQSVANIIGMAMERFSYEEQLLSSLQEKQVLIKEIHHRVKNNLQIVSSLLNLQSLQITDNNTLDIFTKSKSRIKSMALIHKLLHSSENLSKINFKDYLVELSDAILESFGSRHIKSRINAEDIFLEPDQATNLGLIVNEIISNSIKHAFISGNEGLITIELLNHDNNVKLTVKDNGKGLPEDFDPDNATTLGMQLINNLIRQVPADLNLEYDAGTKYTLAFKPK
jgi:two-component sensor histidine kinase/integral membrane sensor domain MASE1